MLERFFAKYYPSEDKVTFWTHQMVKKGLEKILSSSSKDLRMFLLTVMEITKKKSSWRPAYPTCSLITDLISKIYA